MANRLKMAKVHAIQVLRSRGWSQRRIAQELGVHRDTVARYVREEVEAAGPGPPKQAISITGSDQVTDPLGGLEIEGAVPGWLGDGSEDTGISIAGSAKAGGSADTSISIAGSTDPGGAAPTGRRSRCEPYRAAIIEMLGRGLSAQRIWQDLTAEHGFNDSYQSVQRFVRKLRATSPLPFRRMECDPGDEAQVDFGTAAPVITSDGKRRRPHLFRIVLSHSRKAYSEAVFRQTTEEFIRCLENAFHHFGGVPKTLVTDNLAAAVTKADWYDPDLNPKILAFCEHYSTVILPTKVRTPRHKGKIEAGVKFTQNNALKGRTFDSLADQNRFLLDWETNVADTRIHGTTRKQVGKLFAEVERAALLPLPAERFPFFREAQRSVHRDAHVEVDKAYYSVSPEFVGRKVWVRWDSHVVRIFDAHFHQLAIHARHQAGRFSTQRPHIAAEKITGVERGTVWLLRKAALIGTETGRWAQAMLEHRGIPGVRVLVGLLALAHRYSDQQIEQACEIARSHGAYRLRVLRELIKRQTPPQDEFEFTTEHPLIRSLGEYGQLVRSAFAEVHA
jgi:transposase